MDAQDNKAPQRRLRTKFLSASIAVCIGKGNVFSLNKQAADSTTFSRWLSSSSVPFLFLIFHVYKNEAERSMPVPLWQESIQLKLGFNKNYSGVLWLYMSPSPSHCNHLSSLSLSEVLDANFKYLKGHFNFFSLAVAIKWYTCVYTCVYIKLELQKIIQPLPKKECPRMFSEY